MEQLIAVRLGLGTLPPLQHLTSATTVFTAYENQSNQIIRLPLQGPAISIEIGFEMRGDLLDKLPVS